jgi:plastocyanin
MRLSRHSAPHLTGLTVMMLSATSSFGSEVDVVVIDSDGQPVADVAVYATRIDGQNQRKPAAARAIMDQVDKQFVPHLLVVQTGTSVEFPNSDTVAHHVYSFSHPNKFTLPMYKGMAHPPVSFEHSGVVTLGCNIHDHMLGYILVVDTATFTKTDVNGTASLSLDKPEDYEINIWSPRIRDGVELLTRTWISSKPAVSFQLASKLKPPHGGQSASWQEY